MNWFSRRPAKTKRLSELMSIAKTVEDMPSRALREVDLMIPVTAVTPGSAKPTATISTWETQLREQAQHVFRRDLIFIVDETRTTFKRQSWMQVLERVKSGGTIVVAWQDRCSRNFDEGVAIQADSTTERIRVDLHSAKSEGNKPGRPQALEHERVIEAQTVYAGNPSLRRTAQIMDISRGNSYGGLGAAMKTALADLASSVPPQALG